MERPSNYAVPAALTTAVVLFLSILAVYITGYFSLCLSKVEFGKEERYRRYAEKWQATIYTPAAMVESLVTGEHIETIQWR